MPSSFEIEPLLRDVARRDPRAFAELYDRTSRYVYGILRRMLSTPEQADEVAQEVYAQVWRTAWTFDPDRGPGWSWLALLTRSRALDHLRAEQSYRKALGTLEGEMTGEVARENPEREAMARDVGDAVRRALAGLSPEQRAALELAFFGGLSHSEIAARTRTPLGTVKTRIRTGLLRMRDALGPGAGRSGGE